MVYVSPYNDLDVIAGQGTLGREIVEQLGSRPLDALVVSVGGGGLISGVAASVKAALPATRVIGTSPVNDAAMAASVRAGKIVEVDARPTISDGTAGGIEPGSITFPLCTELVDEWVLVSEEQIHAALRMTIDTEHQLVEGAAATAIAAGLETGRAHPARPSLSSRAARTSRRRHCALRSAEEAPIDPTAHSAEIPGPAGAYSPVRRVGPFVQISGQAAKDLAADAAGQTTQALEQIQTLLAREGLGWPEVLMVRVYLADDGYWADMDAAYRRLVAEPYPARTTVSAGLGPRMLVEIDALAVAT